MNEVATPLDEQSQGMFSKILKSMSLIVILTIVFGGLSYALIQLNHTVLKLSISEGVWCGLAMALATVYYLWINKRKPS